MVLGFLPFSQDLSLVTQNRFVQVLKQLEDLVRQFVMIRSAGISIPGS